MAKRKPQPNHLFGKHPSQRKSTRRLAKIKPVSPAEFKKWVEDSDISLYQLSQVLDCTWVKIKSAMNGSPSTCRVNEDGSLRIPNSMALALFNIQNGTLLAEDDPFYHEDVEHYGD